jgi:hypothetical protein
MLLKYTSELGILISPPKEPNFQRAGRQLNILYIALISNISTDKHHQAINELDSDHLPVITTLYEQAKINVSNPKLINRLINWDTFRENLDKNIKIKKNPQNNCDIDSNTQHLTESIQDAIKSA